jgi:hypothetical protein
MCAKKSWRILDVISGDIIQVWTDFRLRRSTGIFVDVVILFAFCKVTVYVENFENVWRRFLFPRDNRRNVEISKAITLNIGLLSGNAHREICIKLIIHGLITKKSFCINFPRNCEWQSRSFSAGTVEIFSKMAIAIRNYERRYLTSILSLLRKYDRHYSSTEFALNLDPIEVGTDQTTQFLLRFKLRISNSIFIRCHLTISDFLGNRYSEGKFFGYISLDKWPEKLCPRHQRLQSNRSIPQIQAGPSHGLGWILARSFEERWLIPVNMCLLEFKVFKRCVRTTINNSAQILQKSFKTMAWDSIRKQARKKSAWTIDHSVIEKPFDKLC